MSVLVIHLGREETERKEAGNLRGLELAISLYREYENQQPVIITAPSERALRFQGSAFFSVVFRSPITGRMVASSSGLAPGYSLYRLGYEAVVITGRARKMQMLSINADGAEMSPADALKGLTALEAGKEARKNMTDVSLAIGRAGENGVLYASLQCDGREVAAMGLGCLLGWKNIKAIVLPGFSRKDSIGSGLAEKRAMRHQERSRISKALKKEGGGRYIDSALRLGWLPVRYYSDRFDPRAFFLDGRAAADAYGVFPDSCQDCAFSCGRRTRDNAILPSWQECIMLGSNLGIFSLENVRKLSDAVREEGLGAVDTGALLAYLGSHPSTDYAIPLLRDRSVDEYVRLVHLIGENRGLSDKLSQGLRAFPDAIATSDHLPILTDLRGDKAGALLVILGLYSELPVSWLLPARPLSEKAAAIMALYECAYRLALISEGYSPMGVIPQWWGRLPSFIFSVPFLLRIAAMAFSAYGLKGRDILRKGLSLMDELRLQGGGRIHEHFSMDPESTYGDGSTVSSVKLMEYYEREKRIALRMLKSRSEKSDRPSAESNAAVGPAEERGLDGDPGLQNTTPSSS